MTKDEVLGRKTGPSQVSYADSTKFTGAVFLYMFLAIAITGVVATVLGALLNQFIFSSVSETVEDAFFGVLIAAFLLYIPTMLWAQFSIRRNSRTMIPAYVTYSVITGVLVSTATVAVDVWEVAIAFGGTCLVFGLMALLAWFSKRSVSIFAMFGFGLMMGLIIISSINLILMLCGVYVPGLYWLISIGMFLAVLSITVVDLRNVKDIAERGGAGTNVALMCALSLYVDFIYIFIRLLGLLARSKR